MGQGQETHASGGERMNSQEFFTKAALPIAATRVESGDDNPEGWGSRGGGPCRAARGKFERRVGGAGKNARGGCQQLTPNTGKLTPNARKGSTLA